MIDELLPHQTLAGLALPIPKALRLVKWQVQKGKTAKHLDGQGSGSGFMSLMPKEKEGAAIPWH